MKTFLLILAVLAGIVTFALAFCNNNLWLGGLIATLGFIFLWMEVAPPIKKGPFVCKKCAQRSKEKEIRYLYIDCLLMWECPACRHVNQHEPNSDSCPIQEGQKP